MRRELLALLVGILGNIASTLVFLSPIVTFYRIMKKKSTESFSPIPYVICLLSQFLWGYYGIIKPKGLLIATISAVGIFFEFLYLGIFVVYASTPNRMYALKLLAVASMTFATLFLGTFFGSSGTTRLRIVGFISAFNSICMFASPLSITRKVITTKSVEYMPFLLTLSLLMNGGIWSTYAIIVKDLFMGVPNGIGFTFGLIQLLLYSIYYKNKPSGVQGKLDLDETFTPTTNDYKVYMEKVEDSYKQTQSQVLN